MRVEADLDRCSMNAVCVVIAPKIFDVDDDEGVQILQEHPDPEQRENAREAVANCPMQALRAIEDDDKGQSA
jgi:ferredoxin